MFQQPAGQHPAHSMFAPPPQTQRKKNLDRFFQLHIPCTGGTSLFYGLSKSHQMERSGWYLTHSPWELIPNGRRVITTLRDPVDRCVSFWNLLYNSKAFSSPEKLQEFGIVNTFERFVTPETWEMKAKPWLTPDPNLQTRMLAGFKGEPAQMLEAAKQHINECAWVGFCGPDFGEYLPALSDLVGYDVPMRWDRSFSDRPRFQADNDEKAKLEELCSLDRQLYDYARAKHAVPELITS